MPRKSLWGGRNKRNRLIFLRTLWLFWVEYWSHFFVIVLSEYVPEIFQKIFRVLSFSNLKKKTLCCIRSAYKKNGQIYIK